MIYCYHQKLYFQPVVTVALIFAISFEIYLPWVFVKGAVNEMIIILTLCHIQILKMYCFMSKSSLHLKNDIEQWNKSHRRRTTNTYVFSQSIPYRNLNPLNCNLSWEYNSIQLNTGCEGSSNYIVPRNTNYFPTRSGGK